MSERRKAIMRVSREWLGEVWGGRIDDLKVDQRQRDLLCVALRLPTGTVLHDCRWGSMDCRFDLMEFLVEYPEFPVAPEGSELPLVEAEYKEREDGAYFERYIVREVPKPPGAEELTRMLRTPIKAKV